MAAKKSYEPVETKMTLNRVTAKSMPFDWSINPYRGCAHGCSFCYARAFQSFIGREADDEFQNRITIKQNAAEALEAQLAKKLKRHGGGLEAMAREIGTVAIGTATDPYQPVEGKAFITRECLKVLAKYRLRTSITTRSPLILRDLDVLTAMRIESVNISINTLRADISRKLEPASPFPAKRLETVETLCRSGIKAGLFIAPILPCLTDSAKDLEQLISAAKAHRAAFAYASVLRLSPDVKAWYMHTLETHFPHLLRAYGSLYAGAYANRAYADRVMELAKKLLERYGFAGRGMRRDAVRPDEAGGMAAATINEFAGEQAAPKQSSRPEAVEQLQFTF
ncbi:SPL family radical SAM protein [Paenibacillus humicola]|uniref:SPL family radical SAM protein n=1 Tax=Paenibacillus humicola TaxID=3110540 RepID=UPI00237C4177|nr:radical SAM protein [Paenibacillus humicola]